MPYLRFSRSLLILAVSWFYLIPTQASACSCRPPVPEDHIAQTPVIFEGRVLRASPQAPQGDEPGDGAQLVEFQTTQVWKGDVGPKAVLFMHTTSGAACGIAFEPGWEGIVFASQLQGGVLTTDLCTMLPSLNLPDERQAYRDLLDTMADSQ